MRKTLAVAALGVAALSVVPMQSASAQCITVYPLPACINVCRIVDGVADLGLNCTL